MADIRPPSPLEKRTSISPRRLGADLCVFRGTRLGRRDNSRGAAVLTSRLCLYLPRELRRHWRDRFWLVPPESYHLLLKLNYVVAFFSASVVATPGRDADPRRVDQRTHRDPATTLQPRRVQLGPLPCAATLAPPSAAQPPAHADPPNWSLLSLPCPSSTSHGALGLLKVLPQRCLTTSTTLLTCLRPSADGNQEVQSLVSLFIRK